MSSPLAGRTILITRTRAQSGSFSALLKARGARVIEVPTIEIVPTVGEELDLSLQCLDCFDWLFFTSANAVEIFFDRKKQMAPHSQPPRICAIGPATAKRVESFGYGVDLQPSLYQAEGVLEAFCDLYGSRLDGLRILLPRARAAREILPQTLEKLGAVVTLIPVYDTVVPPDSAQLLRDSLSGGGIDLITFTSSSTVRNFMNLVDEVEPLRKLRFAAIGPITTDTAREFGLAVAVQPQDSTIPAFVEAIETYFSGK